MSDRRSTRERRSSYRRDSYDDDYKSSSHRYHRERDSKSHKYEKYSSGKRSLETRESSSEDERYTKKSNRHSDSYYNDKILKKSSKKVKKKEKKAKKAAKKAAKKEKKHGKLKVAYSTEDLTSMTLTAKNLLGNGPTNGHRSRKVKDEETADSSSSSSSDSGDEFEINPVNAKASSTKRQKLSKSNTNLNQSMPNISLEQLPNPAYLAPPQNQAQQNLMQLAYQNLAYSQQLAKVQNDLQAAQNSINQSNRVIQQDHKYNNRIITTNKSLADLAAENLSKSNPASCPNPVNPKLEKLKKEVDDRDRKLAQKGLSSTNSKNITPSKPPKKRKQPKQTSMEELQNRGICGMRNIVSRESRGPVMRGDSSIPNKLNDYDIVSQVGEGTFGQVYKGRDKFGELVALKKVRLDKEKEGFPITTIREVKVLKELTHQNMIRLRDICVVRQDHDPDNPFATHEENRSRSQNPIYSFYLIFDYCDHDLHGLLESGMVDFKQREIKYMMYQLIDALAYCHDRNFMHRDIKPSNILINREGIVKVADFGLARLFDDTRDRLYTNRVITLWYRPPELLLGQEKYTTAVDVWSMGCILGELFNKKAIFQANQELDQLEKIMRICGTPKPSNWPDVQDLPLYASHQFSFRNYDRKLKQEFPTIPSDCLELLDKMLTLDPNQRIKAADALEHNWLTEIHTNGGINSMRFRLSLPQDHDCHEMWSKERKKKKRLGIFKPEPLSREVAENMEKMDFSAKIDKLNNSQQRSHSQLSSQMSNNSSHANQHHSSQKSDMSYRSNHSQQNGVARSGSQISNNASSQINGHRQSLTPKKRRPFDSRKLANLGTPDRIRMCYNYNQHQTIDELIDLSGIRSKINPLKSKMYATIKSEESQRIILQQEPAEHIARLLF